MSYVTSTTRKLLRPTAGVVICGTLCGPASVCALPLQWPSEEGGNGHYYELVVVPNRITWTAARSLAATSTYLGIAGHLASLTSQGEDEWVWTNLQNPHGAWLGGFQEPGSPEPGAGWRWVTGELWNYTNWALGEPNNAAILNGEDALEFNNATDNQWNDFSGAYGDPAYIVEYDDEPTPAAPRTWSGIKLLYR